MPTIENGKSTADNLNEKLINLEEIKNELNKLTENVTDNATDNFYEKGDDGEVTYKMDVVQKYLSSVKDRPFSDTDAKSARMTAIQIALESQGYDVGVIDGKFGPLTREKIGEFQSKNGLKVDGIPGPETVGKLVELLNKVDENGGDKTENEGENVTELNEVVVNGYQLRPKNPISFGSETVEMEESKSGKLEGVGAFDGNGNFVFESNIHEETEKEGNTTVTLDNDVYTRVEYTEGKGLSIQPFTGKGYQRGDSGATKWFFIGEYNAEDKTGTGKRVFENGSFYEGEWKDTLENGKGVYTYANGDKYEGEFKDGKEEGSGKYTFKNGNEYVGLFKDDKFEGEGKYTVKEENRDIVLEGTFSDSKFVSGTVTIGRETHNVTYRDEKLYVTIGNGENSNQYVDMNTWEVKDLNSEIV